MKVMLVDMTKFTLGANVKLIENKEVLETYNNVTFATADDIVEYAEFHTADAICFVGNPAMTEAYKQRIQNNSKIKVVNFITDIIKGGQA